MRKLIFILFLLAGVTFAAVYTTPGRALVRQGLDEIKFAVFLYELEGVERQSDVMIPMADGIHLATDIYLPSDRDTAYPTVLMRLPYDKRMYPEARQWIQSFATSGYAVVVQDMRGRHQSEGVFKPWVHEAQDGSQTLDWISRQDWSNGRVGTIGCSALGETQMQLAMKQHSAHWAMIPINAGGAAGTVGGLHGFFGMFEGGIPTLAPAVGWFARHGGKTPDKMKGPAFDPVAALATLPLRNAVASVRHDPTDFETLIDGFNDPDFWQNGGFLTGDEWFLTPALIVDSWYDPGLSGSLNISRQLRRSAPGQHMLITPGIHCDLTGPFEEGKVGDLPVATDSALNFADIFAEFFDHFLKDEPYPDLPPYRYYVMQEDVWRDAESWPPEDAVPYEFILDGKKLIEQSPSMASARSFFSDPLNPVPSIGGAICCTGDPESRAGPLLQNEIEGRDDILVFTSEPLGSPMRLAGPLTAILNVTIDTPDTDLVLRLTDVDPEGRSLMIQEGALRLRYRRGYDRPVMIVPDHTYRVSVSLKHIAYLLKPGHRLRLHVAGSSFPRLGRNMNRETDPNLETKPVPAQVTIYSSPSAASVLKLTVLPD